MSLLVGRSDRNSEDLNNNESIGSSALQKAIDRNKQKQIEKAQRENDPNDKNISPNVLINRSPVSIEEKLKQLKAPLTLNLSSQPLGQINQTLNERVEINKISSPNLGLAGAKPGKSKWKDFKENFLGYVVKLMWIFGIVLFLRLVFAERGVLEYYFRRKKVQEKMDTFDKQVFANKKLKKEIDRIERDITYQKSLVRNNLGFIADDEFIIVLPEPKNKI